MFKSWLAAIVVVGVSVPAWAFTPIDYMDQTGSPGMLRAFCLDTEKGRADLKELIDILDRGDNELYSLRMRDPKVMCADLELAGQGRIQIILVEMVERYETADSCLESWLVESPTVPGRVLTVVECKEVPNEDV